MSITADDGSTRGIQAAYDDPAAPSELTLFSGDRERVTTRWVTIDVEHAVDLSRWV